jgi:hypothetical protein
VEGGRRTVTDLEPGTSVPGGVTRYRRRPVVVEMLEWTGANAEAVREFCGRGAEGWRFEPPAGAGRAAVWNDQEHAWIPLAVGHRVVKGALGEVWPISPEAVAATYEPADGPTIAAAGPAPDDTPEVSATAPERTEPRPAPSSSGEAIAYAALDRAIQRMRIAEAEVLTMRTELASAQNAIGQVLRKAGSWQMQGGVITTWAVARWLTDALAPWTGKGRSEEGDGREH